MYKIDLLRQIEANTRGGSVSDCYSKYDLWRMIERNTRTEKPVLPPYQLANGTWDMSNRELVSFTRSTKAWLDGKEYAPDEPRYTKEGKLLIEPQATNIITTANRVNGWASGGGWQGDPKYVKINGVDVATRIATDICSAWGTASIVSDPLKTYSARLITKINPSFTEIENDDRGFTPSMTFSGGLPNLGVVGKCEVTGYELLNDGFIAIDCKFKNVSTNLYTVFFGDGHGECEFAFGWVGIEEGETLTSPMPISASQITRAADIATVRDK